MHDANEGGGGNRGGTDRGSVSSRAERPPVAGPEAGRSGTQPSGRRLDVLDVLREAPEPLDSARIAARLAVHPNTVRFHLDRLVRDGLVEHAPPARRGTGRPPMLFRAVRRAPGSGARHYRMLAEVLIRGMAAGPDPSAHAVEAGRAWGRDLAAKGGGPAGRGGRQDAEGSVARLVDLLDTLGFAPERGSAAGGGTGRLALRNCPFLELAETGGQVVCPVHLGVMQGAMAGWDAPVTVDRLARFAEPDLCVAHLAPVGGVR